MPLWRGKRSKESSYCLVEDCSWIDNDMAITDDFQSLKAEWV